MDKKHNWKTPDNNIFKDKLINKINKMIKFINIKPSNFNNDKKIKFSKEAISFIADEVIFSIVEAQRDGIIVGDKNIYLNKKTKEDYERKIKNLVGLLSDYKRSVVELYGESSLVSLEAYMSSKEILMGSVDDPSSLDFHLSVLEEYVRNFPEDLYNLPWIKLAIKVGNERAHVLSCNA